jgi:hypothetical protein
MNFFGLDYQISKAFVYRPQPSESLDYLDQVSDRRFGQANEHPPPID